MKTVYVIRCADLYIKRGGFTKDIREAKKYRSLAEASHDWVRPWVIERIAAA